MIEPAYPPRWEADVVLVDGGTVHLRPITPGDAGRLVELHARLSPETIYNRFFGAYPRLSDRDVRRFTELDYVNRVALVATLAGELVAVVRYDRLSAAASSAPEVEAEVAFVVQDAHQGRGIGSVLLEHLAAIALENGVRRFVAEVLPGNRRMARVFADAGFSVLRDLADGTLHLQFPIEPTAASLEVMRGREHRAEARSIERLLVPGSVAVVGASAAPHTVGNALFTNLLAGGFRGPVYPVNPNAAHVGSVRAYPSVLEVPDDIDLAVVATPAGAVEEVVRQCARKGVRGVVVVSSGFSEAGESGRTTERSLVRHALAHGIRVIGPNCLGIVNTDPRVSLNASLAPLAPSRGRVGFFCQSGALGIAILESVAERGIGLSTFVSAGNRADVSGNDLLQYWEDDPDTDVVLLYLESFGNPRKFVRLARRLARRKPVVAVKSGRSATEAPHRPAGAAGPLPDAAVTALFAAAGVIRVDTLSQLFDVAQLLAYQPLPAGPRVAIVGNSAALGVLTADACAGADLQVAVLSGPTLAALGAVPGSGTTGGNPVDLGADSGPESFRTALSAVLADDGVDAVVTVFVPPLAVPNVEVASVLAQVTRQADKPVLSTFLAFEGLPEQLRSRAPDGAPVRGSIPSYVSPETAVAALALVTRYAHWRARDLGTAPSIADLDPDAEPDAARALVRQAVPGGSGQPPAQGRPGNWLPALAAGRLLAAYGVHVWPARPVRDADEAIAAAEELGFPVALKSTADHLRHRSDLGAVRLDIADAVGLRAAHAAALDRLGPEAGLEVQAMAAPGVPVVIEVTEDPSFGPVVSFGLGGVATDLLADRAFRPLPLTEVDAAELIRAVRAAPLLFGYRGTEPVDTPALQRLLLRVAALGDDLPEVAWLGLNPVLVSRVGVTVLDARVWVAPPVASPDSGPRRL